MGRWNDLKTRLRTHALQVAIGLVALIVLLLARTHVAATPTRLSSHETISGAPIAAAVQVKSARTIEHDWWFRVFSPARGLPSREDLVTCEFLVDVLRVFRGDLGVSNGNQTVRWYVPKEDCRASRAGLEIWFLRTELGFVRPALDLPNRLLLGKRAHEAINESSKHKFADSRVSIIATLLLSHRGTSPHLGEDEQVRSAFRQIDQSYSWAVLMEASAMAWEHLSEAERLPLCAELGDFGACLVCRGKAIEAGYAARYRAPVESALQANMEGLRQRPNDEGVRAELLAYACSSFDSVREGARTALQRRFGIAAEKIPCPRCE